MSLFGTFWTYRPTAEVKFCSVAFQNCISYLFFFFFPGRYLCNSKRPKDVGFVALMKIWIICKSIDVQLKWHFVSQHTVYLTVCFEMCGGGNQINSLWERTGTTVSWRCSISVFLLMLLFDGPIEIFFPLSFLLHIVMMLIDISEEYTSLCSSGKTEPEVSLSILCIEVRDTYVQGQSSWLWLPSW